VVTVAIGRDDAGKRRAKQALCPARRHLLPSRDGDAISATHPTARTGFTVSLMTGKR